MHEPANKIAWIDMARGMGMILVMLGHSAFPLNRVIYVFHIPLFFFLSGYLYNESKYHNPSLLIKNKSKHLLVPYLAFAVINFAVHVFSTLAEKHTIVMRDVLVHVAGPFVAIRNTAWTSGIGPFWFISCLFVTEILYCLIVNRCKSWKYRMAAVGVLSAMGFCYAKRIATPLPWSIDVASIAILFFAGGHFVRSRYPRIPALPIWVVAPSILCIVIASRQWVDMFVGRYGNEALFMAGAFSGILCILMVAYRLPAIRPIEYVGQYSIAFLCLHQYPVYPTLAHIRFGSIHPFSGNTLIEVGWTRAVFYALVTVVSACLSIYPVSEFLRRYFPKLLGAR